MFFKIDQQFTAQQPRIVHPKEGNAVQHRLQSPCSRDFTLNLSKWQKDIESTKREHFVCIYTPIEFEGANSNEKENNKTYRKETMNLSGASCKTKFSLWACGISERSETITGDTQIFFSWDGRFNKKHIQANFQRKLAKSNLSCLARPIGIDSSAFSFHVSQLLVYTNN